MHSQREGKIDLRNVGDNPTILLLLLCECKNQNLKLGNGESAFEWLKNNLDENEMFSQLPESRQESDKLNFLANYVDNLDSAYGSYFVLRHVISELANNVYDHSRDGKHNLQRYILSNVDLTNEKLEISIIDDGISIPGLFEEVNVEFENDCHAISKSIDIFSTVSDAFYERGNGLRTIVRLIGEGNDGEILIVSRNGCLHIMVKTTIIIYWMRDIYLMEH